MSIFFEVFMELYFFVVGALMLLIAFPRLGVPSYFPIEWAYGGAFLMFVTAWLFQRTLRSRLRQRRNSAAAEEIRSPPDMPDHSHD